MSTTVHVKGISHQTSEKEIRDFFSFCGKIQSLSVTPESSDAHSPQSATVTFEKETAAKTALLLDNTQLGPAQVRVSSAASLDQVAGGRLGHDEEDIPQEDKPRSRIVAEYLAHGYVLSDQAIQRAIDLDKQHGISARFTNSLQQFDQKYKASERAQAVDQKYGISQRGQQAWLGLNSYFEKAATTPTGQRIRAFYEQGAKQVMDVHNEAKHLASLKSGKQSTTAAAVDETHANLQNVAGTSYSRNLDEKATEVTPEQAQMEPVEVKGEKKTKCNCGGNDSKCPCEEGKCACSGCSKAS